MPLRVTKEYSTGDDDGKKVHRKMSKNGHYQKVRRPTGLEVYNDAAKILEELLEKRIDRNVRVGRQRRNRTDPAKERESTVNTGSDNFTVTRCKTMPSRYRESFEDELNKKHLDEENEEEKRKRKKKEKERLAGVETDSSANDTEGESDVEDTNVTKNRKKKSLFKRAKENLIRTFHRDQKDAIGRNEPEGKDHESYSFRKRKTKKKSSSVVSESKRSFKGHLNKDKSIDYTEVVDYRHSKPSSNTESLSRKSRSGSMSRNSLMNVIRNPFNKKSSHQTDNLDDDEKNRRYQSENGVRAVAIDDDGDVTTYPQPLIPAAAAPARPTPPPNSVGIQHEKRESDKRMESSPLSPSSPTQTNHIQQDGRGGTLSSTSTHYPTSEYNNSVGSLNFLPSSKSNVLDSPGEEIGFIDEEEEIEKRKSIIKYHGSEGLLNLQWLAEQTANAKAFDFEIDEHSVSTRRPDGQVELVTTVTATRTVILPEVEEEDMEEDDHDGNGPHDDDKPEPPKEELYGKIAQKLIEMADTYGASMSDAEERGEATAAALGDAPLTDLEKEIIACLRSGGDKYGKKMEDQLDAMKSAVTDDAYDRFRSTVENSMGHELSWNTLALLYYSTKGVVSAVGKSSKVATQTKEFTLKYISDTFVSWIMEQGGFDSMLSGSESDPELD